MKTEKGERGLEVFNLQYRKVHLIRSFTLLVHEKNANLLVIQPNANPDKLEVYETEFTRMIRETYAAFRAEDGLVKK